MYITGWVREGDENEWDIKMNNLKKLDLVEISNAWKKNSDPFSHVVVDDFFVPEIAKVLYAEMKEYVARERNSFVKYDQRWEKLKFTQNKLELMPHGVAGVVKYFNSDAFIGVLEEITGLRGLVSDPMLWGGGIHCTLAGGKLDIHNDFTILPTTYDQSPEWHRVINLIVYLNKAWLPEWKGELEFWDSGMSKCVSRVAPKFNRAAIFYTDGSNHGQPDPYLGPEEEPRMSLATYYYLKVPPGSVEKRSTLYQVRPGDIESSEEKQARLKRASPDRYKGFSR